MKKNSKPSTTKRKSKASPKILKITDRRKNITDWPTHAKHFPYRLEWIYHNDKIIAMFECEHHLNKHLIRYKLNKKNSRIDIFPEHTHTFKSNYKKPKRQLFSTLEDFFQ